MPPHVANVSCYTGHQGVAHWQVVCSEALINILDRVRPKNCVLGALAASQVALLRFE